MSIEASLTQRLATEGVAYAPQIVGAALRHGIDPTLLAAVAAQETGGPGSNTGHNIVGDGGHGRGLFQIDDRWHDFARTTSAMDPAQNAEYAADMVAGLLKRYGGDVHKALSAYNAGDPNATGTKTRWEDGAVLGYADSVLRHLQNLDDARANDSDTVANVNLLLSFSQSAQPTTAFTACDVTPPAQHRSWAEIEGLDATGHRRDGQTEFFGGDEQ